MARPEVQDLGVQCATCRDGYVPQPLCDHCGARHCPACARCEAEREKHAAWLKALHGPTPPEVAGQILGRPECAYAAEVGSDRCAGPLQGCGNCVAHCECDDTIFDGE